MSLSTLADEEVLRADPAAVRARMAPVVRARAMVIRDRFGLEAAEMGNLQDELMPLAAENPTPKTKGSDALNALARYIPTEALTLYVAAIAAMSGSSAIKSTFGITAVQVYWFFAVLTPILFVLIYAGKKISAGQPALPESVAQWPWWKTIASTVAFLVWALAIPGSPYLDSEPGKIIAGFAVLLVSTFLTLLDPFFEPRPAAQA